MKPELLTELFNRAEAAEIGIAVETNNQTRLQIDLCDHAREAGMWKDLMVTVPSIPGYVYIVHKSVELDA